METGQTTTSPAMPASDAKAKTHQKAYQKIIAAYVYLY
uniref:Uncharacterized protein n=1 Tax=uncultured bacterium A1Q1_fos_500 TaxID=1256579 RepID=L7VY69_9BACT|nr:hypothetical protein [uncultured bacterium A1Q1_fos_500]